MEVTTTISAPSVDFLKTNIVFLQSSNYMNTSLLTLYRKENPDSLPETAVDVQTKSSTPPQVTSDTRISEGGWFIDKTPARKEDNFFIDLCAEEESDSSKQLAEVPLLLLVT